MQTRIILQSNKRRILNTKPDVVCDYSMGKYYHFTKDFLHKQLGIYGYLSLNRRKQKDSIEL